MIFYNKNDLILGKNVPIIYNNTTSEIDDNTKFSDISFEAFMQLKEKNLIKEINVQ